MMKLEAMNKVLYMESIKNSLPNALTRSKEKKWQGQKAPEKDLQILKIKIKNIFVSQLQSSAEQYIRLSIHMLKIY